jgi:hypothetical protein
VHHLAVKALARFDGELLRIMLPWLPFETSDQVSERLERSPLTDQLPLSAGPVPPRCGGGSSLGTDRPADQNERSPGRCSPGDRSLAVL